MTIAFYKIPQTPKSTSDRRKRGIMSSDKFHSLVGMQDTENAMKHVRLMANERKRLSSLTNWKPLGVFSIAGEDSPFLVLVRSFFVSFYEHIPPIKPFVWFAVTNTKER